MTSKVLVSITGTHIDEEGEDTVQTVQPGTYKYMQGKHIVIYEEILEESLNVAPVTAQCLLKMAADSVSLRKKGDAHADMHFEAGKSHETLYDTPMGTMHMRLTTTKLQLEEREDYLCLKLEYGLDMNYNHISDCRIQIEITPKEADS